MLKIGVLGVGHLGKIHIKCINLSSHYELVGFYDPNRENALKVAEEYGTHSFDCLENLIDAVDVVDIVTPTIHHFESASLAIQKNKHVFIEKPIVATPEEARKLIALAKQARVKIQVGHVERFNPAYIALQPFLKNPMFIEAHRLAEFNPRGCDVPVALDLMIHDIDIVLNAIKSEVRFIHASGVNVVGDTYDITNARLEFENGAVANLTASRISMKNMRKMRFFQENAYLTVDFLNKTTEIVTLHDVTSHDESDPFAMIFDLGDEKPKKKITFKKPEIIPINAIQTELEAFSNAILTDTEPPVTVEDGCKALEIAYRILEESNRIHLQAKG
jgi:predicted dehydrogenase